MKTPTILKRALLSALVFIVVFIGAVALKIQMGMASLPPPDDAAKMAGIVKGELALFDERDEKMYEKLRPSVCQVFFLIAGVRQGHGTGFVAEIAGKRYIVSAAHVFQPDAETRVSKKGYEFEAVFEGGHKVKLDSVKIAKGCDVAFASLPDDFPGKIPAVRFAEKNPKVGADVWGVGYPLHFRVILSKGLVTGYSDGKIVVDSGVIFGNSGGFLTNKDAQVVGVVSMVASDSWQAFPHLGILVAVEDIRKEFPGK